MSDGKKKKVPHPKVLRKRFRLILKGKIKDKRRTLEELRISYRHPWDLGYILGMQSVIENKRVSMNGEVKISRIYDMRALNELRNHFMMMSKNRLLRGFDRGYFTALADAVKERLRNLKREAKRTSSKETK